MKKNLLFHPLVRGLCLILCLTALLGCAYTGLRCIFMDTSGVMENKPEFSPLTYYSGAVAGDVIYWPGNYEWNELIIISGEDRWYYNDDLLNRIVDLLSAAELSDYLAAPAENGNPDEADTLFDEIEEYHAEGTDIASESVTSSDAAVMPDLLIDGDRGCIYPAYARRYALDFLDWFPRESSNLRFCVLLDGIPMFGNSTDMDSEVLQNAVEYSAAIYDAVGDTGHTLGLRLGLCEGLPVDDAYRVYYDQWESDVAHWEEWMVATGILAAASLVLLCITLVQAGKRYAVPSVHLNLIDRLPLEPVLAAKAVILCLTEACVMEMWWEYRYEKLL
ncbi:MAG: hypothetical protein IJ302_00695, partial [Clostridia bacterium]|nr:hypothetical protein [Clostridia bacterium]